MPSSTSKEQILSLKRQALQAKREGNLEAAKAFLRQAKQLEAANEQPEGEEKQQEDEQQRQEEQKEEDHPTEENKEQQQQPVEDPVNQAIDSATLEELETPHPTTATSFGYAELLDVAGLQELRDCGMDIPSAAFYDQRILSCKQKALQHKKANEIEKAKQALRMAKKLQQAKDELYSTATNNVADEDDALLVELSQEDMGLLAELQNYDEHGRNLNDAAENVCLPETHGELLVEDIMDDDTDVATLVDMVVDAGFVLPSVEKVQALANEKQADALAAKKQGDLAAAKTALIACKRLQKAVIDLKTVSAAVERKIKMQTESSAFGEVDASWNDENGQDPDMALEKLVRAAEAKETAPKTTTDTKLSAKSTPVLQPASHYKAQAVKFKQEGDPQRALAALRLYKQALTVEAQAQAAAQRQACLAELQSEVEIATEQARIFSYYQFFVDPKTGNTMAAGWRRYARDCAAYAVRLKQASDPGAADHKNQNDSGQHQKQEEKEVSADQLPTSLQRSQKAALLRLDDSHLCFVGSSCDATEQRLQISIVAILGLSTNQHLRRVIPDVEQHPVSVDHIRIRLTAHLPAHEHALEEDVKLEFSPTQLLSEGSDSIYLFDSSTSQFIRAERGTSRFAKTFARRLSRRRCLSFEVLYLRPKSTKPSKGLFGRLGGASTRSMEESEEMVLGTAGLELSDLLEKNYVATDIPMVESRRQLGGVLRVAVRSGTSFGDTKPDPGEETDTSPLLGFPHLLLPR